MSDIDPKKRWMQCENTFILMKQVEVGQLVEWHPVGHIILRQVYKDQPPAWYGYHDPGDEKEMTLLNRFDRPMEAKIAIEKACGV